MYSNDFNQPPDPKEKYVWAVIVGLLIVAGVIVYYINN